MQLSLNIAAPQPSTPHARLCGWTASQVRSIRSDNRRLFQRRAVNVEDWTGLTVEALPVVCGECGREDCCENQ